MVGGPEQRSPPGNHMVAEGFALTTVFLCTQYFVSLALQDSSPVRYQRVAFVATEAVDQCLEQLVTIFPVAIQLGLEPVGLIGVY